MASLTLLKGQTASQHTRDSPYGENFLHSSSMFLNPYSKRYARYLTLYRNGSHYIETGYRYCKSSYGSRAFLTAFSNFALLTISLGAPPGSVRKCIHSWTHLHNESVNIYSHVFGSLLFLTIPTYVSRLQISPRFAVATPADIAVCSIYFVGISVRFFLSAIYHIIMNHSYEYSILSLEPDYQGITLLIGAPLFP